MKNKLLINLMLLCWLFQPIMMQSQTKKWTVMVYMNADNNLESFGIKDFLEMSNVQSSDDVNVIVQMDRTKGYSQEYGDWEQTLRFKIQKGMAPYEEKAIMDIGEQNMGDPNVLKDFINWSKINYPAERYVLVIWDHGDGWRFANQAQLDEKTKQLFVKDYREALIEQIKVKKYYDSQYISLINSDISNFTYQKANLTNDLNFTSKNFKMLPIELKTEVTTNTNFEELHRKFQSFLSANIEKIPNNQFVLADSYSSTISKLISIETSIDLLKNKITAVDTSNYNISKDFEKKINFSIIDIPPVKAVSHDGTSNDVLYNKEIQDNLIDHEINVIGFDACLMSMLETAYALRGKAEFIVGSEELEPGDGWNYKLWLGNLVLNPNMSPIELSKVIVESYKKNYENFDSVTLSAIDASSITTLCNQINDLSALLIDNMKTERKNVSLSRDMCDKYAPSEASIHSIDLYLFVHQLSKRTSNLEIKTKCEKIKSLIGAIVVANFKSIDRDFFEDNISFGSFGLAIYFPKQKEYFEKEPAYKDGNTLYPVQFVKDFKWDNFLQTYYKN